MDRIDLNGAWELRASDEKTWQPALAPGSVYADLLRNGKMDDPFYRDNEAKALRLMEHDYIYRRAFALTDGDLACDALLLNCHGLDTLATVSVNGQPVFQADNMHRTWTCDVLDSVRAGENTIEIEFRSPTRFIRDAYRAIRADGSPDAMRGFPHLRKAHCMFGWDWGPRLPDAGIWRDIELLKVHEARLLSVFVHQEHGEGAVTLSFEAELETFDGLCECTRPEYGVSVTVTAPDGSAFTSDGDDIEISDPQLWWPNGFGAQPLYTVRVELVDEDESRVLDVWERRIGLRTLTMRREKDQWGESFATCVNGVQIFAMGGDYIPEDNILSRVTPETTRRLLEDAKLAHHNAIRVWGGGYYPSDWFYDICDELGLIVWQDFMFACAVYELTPDFDENIRQEVRDNVRRIRHHASLGLWCGNNEMEMFVDMGHWVSSAKQKADYIKMYEYIIPQELQDLDPDTFYWPASPSSGGSFDAPNDPDRGDVHYWDVWHGGKPFSEYRKFFFRYASEFGFQSLPSLKTIERFTEPADRNMFSYVMEKHQRNDAANGKIMNYMAQTYRYPKDFDHLVYASQLLQAEAIKYGVEHWRRHRGRCMGAIYWQLNDCWPVASWASIDYYGRWKALHYASKRFFAPLLLSCQEEGTLSQNTNVNAEPFPLKKSARLNVSNETMQEQKCTVRWALRDAGAKVLRQGETELAAPALSAVWMDELCFPEADERAHYFSYELLQKGELVSSGTCLFCAPKHFRFADPELSIRREGEALVISAQAYAKSIEIICDDGDPIFEDNFFDLNGGERRIRMLRGGGTKFRVRSAFDIG